MRSVVRDAGHREHPVERIRRFTAGAGTVFLQNQVTHAVAPEQGDQLGQRTTLNPLEARLPHERMRTALETGDGADRARSNLSRDRQTLLTCRREPLENLSVVQ